MLHSWIFLTFFRPSYEIELAFRRKACRNLFFFLYLHGSFMKREAGREWVNVYRKESAAQRD